MKNISLLMAAPTAKVIIGQTNSIELDTATTPSGQQAFNIKIVTDKDTIQSDIRGENAHEIKEIVEEMIHEKGNNILHEHKEELAISIISIVSIFVLIPAMIIGFLVYRNRQKQKLYESMIANGINPIENEAMMPQFQTPSSPQSFKYLKYGIIIGAIGSSFVLSSVLERLLDIDAGIGLLLLFLGGAFFYLHKVSQEQTTKTTANNSTNKQTNSEE